MKLKLSILLLFLLVSACANNSANKDVDDSQPINVSTDFDSILSKRVIFRTHPPGGHRDPRSIHGDGSRVMTTSVECTGVIDSTQHS